MTNDGSGAVAVLIPAPLRRYAGGQSTAGGSGADVAALLDDLDGRFPGLRRRVGEDDDTVRRFVNVFVNGTNARVLDGQATPLHRLTNLEPGTDRYRVDDTGRYALTPRIDGVGEDVRAIDHSHPTSPAGPPASHLELAAWPDAA